MSLILEPLSCLISLGLLLLFVMALASPFEALGWWAGWTKKGLEPPALDTKISGSDQAADFYLVYLTAIGGISAEDISSRERRFLKRLEEALPGKVAMVDDVFPFSVTNNPLNCFLTFRNPGAERRDSREVTCRSFHWTNYYPASTWPKIRRHYQN